MRYFYVVLCGLSYSVQAQGTAADHSPPAPDSARFAAGDERRVRSTTDSTGACAELLRGPGAGGLVRVFYASGRLKQYVPYSDLAAGCRHGVVTTWFENGQLSAMQQYWQGQRTGTFCLYYETGALKRSTSYVDDNELPGSCFDAAGQPVAYFPYEQPPLYPGGHAQLSKEIKRALRLPRQLPPATLLEPRLIDIAFQVTEDGSMQQPQVVLSSRVPALDEAALAAVAKLSRHFNPGRRDGQVIACTYHVPLEFKSPVPLRPARKL